MHPILKAFIPRVVKSKFDYLEARITSLERSLDIMISSPVYTGGEEVGFNGQRYRKEIFNEILAAFPFQAIVETGTCFGNTTGYMSSQQRNLPVYTCEVDKRYLAVARARLKSFHSIHFYEGDSRDFLNRIADELKGKLVFFYLDAHWYADLPLVSEIELIARHWTDYVIMVDDFKVPGDDGYGFDTYGDQELSLALLQPVIDRHSIKAYFPKVGSSKETGERRGTVVLTSRGGESAMQGVPSLSLH